MLGYKELLHTVLGQEISIRGAAVPVGQRLHSPARKGASYLECQVQGLVLQVQDPLSAPSFRS